MQPKPGCIFFVFAIKKAVFLPIAPSVPAINSIRKKLPNWELLWYPVGESNPCSRRERAVS